MTKKWPSLPGGLSSDVQMYKIMAMLLLVLPVIRGWSLITVAFYHRNLVICVSLPGKIYIIAYSYFRIEYVGEMFDFEKNIILYA